MRQIDDPKTGSQQVKEDLALAHRVIAHENMHEGTWTHLSVMDPDAEGLMHVSPGRRHFADIYTDDLLTMDATGAVVAGGQKPNQAAWCLHYPLHVARADAACVIHLHAKHACALLMQDGARLDEQGSQCAATLYQQIAYYDVYDGVLREAEEGERMAAVLGDQSVLALRNHGFMTVGATVAIALERAYNFERACELQLLASAGGHRLNRIPDSLIAEICREENLYIGGYLEGMRKYFERKGW